MQAEIPADIEERYQGQWIAWDIVTSHVVGTGETLEDAIEASNEAWNAGHELYFHHILTPDAVIVGGL
ncbi:MAG: DUF5678 domain-containing protein [Planctomycetota bacterium]|nr:DUF5678 domain-containing protein [Planctomycetota bacterium]